MVDFRPRGPSIVADFLESIASANGNVEPISRQRSLELGVRFGGLSESEIDEAFQHLRNRARALGAKYPFDVGANFIVAREVLSRNPYFLFSIVSSGSIYRILPSWDLAVAAKMFENVAEQCLSQFFGSDTKSVNFGHPSTIGRPSEFEAAVSWLTRLIGLSAGSSYRPPRRQDGGVDLFVWKHFNDEYPGSPILMVQCTIGDDYLQKIGDVDVRLWSGWLSSDLNPLVAIAVPKEIVDKSEWSELSARGFLLDRMRLVSGSPVLSANANLGEENFVSRLLVDLRELVT